jgi:ATP synthase protein I
MTQETPPEAEDQESQAAAEEDQETQPAGDDVQDSQLTRQEELLQDIGSRERRKLRRRRENHTIWFGLGMFGLIGWSIAIPTLIGIAVALWANSIRPGTWTLGFFFLGLAIGCLNAWNWIMKEQRIMEREREEDGDE